MFGYVKKDDVVALVKREVDLNRQMHDRYEKMAATHREHAEKSECYERELAKCTAASDEYFARYLECKEILRLLDAM
jgi:hypothetical protein